ncbi:hypothetical protein [Streptosporangium sp. LJ11]|uniref:hypothetical protein n=1 Tax=Streptosporangium sp. LJ11 TaxID=3436927 RepID=UPI003F7A307F
MATAGSKSFLAPERYLRRLSSAYGPTLPSVNVTDAYRTPRFLCVPLRRASKGS